MKITKENLSILLAMDMSLIHAVDLVTRRIKLYYEQSLEETEAYKTILEHNGIAAARYWKSVNGQEILERNDKMNFKRWMTEANRLIAQTEPVTEYAMECAKESGRVSQFDMFDDILRDSNLMCRLMLLLYDIKLEDLSKVEKTISLFRSRNKACKLDELFINK